MQLFRSFSVTFCATLVLLLVAACGETPSGGTPSGPEQPPLPTLGTPPVAEAGYCENGGAVVPAGGEPLAARVNGTAIALSLYERQVTQLRDPLILQGLDPNTDQGKQALAGLQAQALAQLIDDVLVEQEATRENIIVSPNEINNRVQQVINDAGGQTKFDQYLENNQLTLQDLCQQIRAFLFGEAMMARVTQNLPTRVEQVRVAHILFANRADADSALEKLKTGADFTLLAKQVSQDEATRDNGGDLGWFPRDVMPPEFEEVAFKLQPGGISGVVSTQLGLHILKLLERDPARPLSPELVQNQRLSEYTTWLEGLRASAKIEKLVQE